MKRYRVATWQRLNKPIPFIYNNKPYALEMKKGRYRIGYCDFYFILTDGKHTVKFDWREVKEYQDLSHNPEDAIIFFNEDNRQINKVAKWLDEQIMTDKEMMDIDDMWSQGKLPNVLRGKMEPDWNDAREETPTDTSKDLIVSTRYEEVGMGHYNIFDQQFYADDDLDGSIKGWMYAPDSYDWRANKEACKNDEEYKQELEDQYWDQKIDESRGK